MSELIKPQLNLYLISRPDGVDYDEFDSIIVAAYDEFDASQIRPNYGWFGENEIFTVKEIGTARPYIERGLILGSFNAG